MATEVKTIIDSHNHLGGPDKGDGRSQSAEELISKMDSAGIDKAVIFPFNNPDEQGSFAAANWVIAKAVNKFPDRFIGFARVDPNYEQAIAEIELAVSELGLKGLKLHPRAQNFHLNDDCLIAVMDKVVELQLPVIFDSGSSNARWPDITELAGRYPEYPLVMAHMHGEGFMEAAFEQINIFLGTTDIKDTSGIERAVNMLGAERIISGSDSPYIDPKSEQEKINSLIISNDAKELIKGENMEWLLSRNKEVESQEGEV